MSIFTVTKEIEKFCLNNSVPSYNKKIVRMLLNYNLNIHNEISTLGKVFNTDSGEITRIATPILICDQITSGDNLVNYYLPAFTIEDFIKDENGNLISNREGGIELALTNKQINKYLEIEDSGRKHEIKPNSEQDIINRHIESLGYNLEFSNILEEYLSEGLDSELNTFNELVCFYFEMNTLTYVDKYSHNLLKNKNIGSALGKVNVELEILEEEARLSGKVLNEDIIKENEIKIQKLIRNYFNNTLNVFRVLSSTNKGRPLTSEEINYSSTSQTSINKFAFHTSYDPLKNKNIIRDSGNPTGLMPTFNQQVLQHMMVGNFPFMTLINTKIDDNIFNTDPLYYIKAYMLQRARDIKYELRDSNNILTEDEDFILTNSNSLSNSMKITAMYSTRTTKDNIKPPRQISYGDIFEIHFLNWSVFNIILKLKGKSYNKDLIQVLDLIAPIKL